MDLTPSWQELLKHPCDGDHLVQIYQDERFLVEAVAEFIGAGLRAGEAAVVIATPGHRAAFARQLEALGIAPEQALRRGQLRLVDAAQCVAQLERDGEPHWQSFHDVLGGTLAELRLQYPTVRAYGEMVDLLWRGGRHEAAIRLEGFWNELARLQTFSLLCAYCMDNLDAGAYGGPLERLCNAHTHLIPARDYQRFNQAVSQASKQVLDQPLAQMLLTMSASHRPPTQMPLGQATLFWLKKNMPRTADKVLTRVRAQLV
jgi:MEDS: MEthanogen/methylotroph, DcmR Sensory domain